jgi:hypothetical protein
MLMMMHILTMHQLSGGDSDGAGSGSELMEVG